MMPNFEIDPWRIAFSTTSRACQDIPGIDPVTSLFGQRPIGPIQTHVAIPMVHDDKKAGSPEPVGEHDAAIMHYGQAIDFQDNLNYTEPPDWSQSIRLYQGAALLKAGRTAEAEAVYRKDMEWNQQNPWSAFGLYQALEAQGKEQAAIIAKRQFESWWRNADVELEYSRLY